MLRNKSHVISVQWPCKANLNLNPTRKFYYPTSFIGVLLNKITFVIDNVSYY